MAEDREARVGLASAVAHDLRTPLAAVRGAARALAEGVEPDDARRLLAVILDAVAQAERLVEDLLTAGRLEAGALPASAETVDVGAAVAEVAAAARAAGARVAIEERLPDEPLSALGDPGRVRQILANLVENAVAHAPEGSVVEIEATRADGRVRVAVSDEGPGVPEEERERIFEPYVRLGERPGGAGLGLYLARGLARAMGGDVVLEPSARGATFVLDLAAA